MQNMISYHTPLSPLTATYSLCTTERPRANISLFSSAQSGSGQRSHPEGKPELAAGRSAHAATSLSAGLESLGSLSLLTTCSWCGKGDKGWGHSDPTHFTELILRNPGI